MGFHRSPTRRSPAWARTALFAFSVSVSLFLSSSAAWAQWSLLAPEQMSFSGMEIQSESLQAESASVAAPLADSESETGRKGGGVDLTARGSSDLRKTGDTEKKASLSYWLEPWVKLSETLQLEGQFVLVQSLTGLRETRFQNGLIALAKRPSELNPYLKFSWTSGVLLPMSTEAIRRESFRGGVVLAPRIGFNLSRLRNTPVLKSLSGYLETEAQKNVHRYETDAQNESNSSWVLTQTARLQLALHPKLKLDSKSQFISRYTYQGTPSSEFLLAEALVYQLSSPLTLAAGVANSGATLKDDFQSSNIALFDRKSSEIFGSLTYRF